MKLHAASGTRREKNRSSFVLKRINSWGKNTGDFANFVAVARGGDGFVGGGGEDGAVVGGGGDCCKFCSRFWQWY